MGGNRGGSGWKTVQMLAGKTKSTSAAKFNYVFMYAKEGSAKYAVRATTAATTTTSGATAPPRPRPPPAKTPPSQPDWADPEIALWNLIFGIKIGAI